ncbi:hypothetical protein B0H14DRAFT_2597485 [Mycena olivaceomarginata]|nr:hypothetical protein B0H14DRAFT_2597485 [Mycena olivaceomarginata]
MSELIGDAKPPGVGTPAMRQKGGSVVRNMGCTGEVGCWQIGPEMLCMCGIEIGWEIRDVPCGREVQVEGVNIQWKVFTGDVLTVEHSLHWSRCRWWLGGKRVIFGHMYVQDKYTVPGPVYRKRPDPRSVISRLGWGAEPADRLASK